MKVFLLNPADILREPSDEASGSYVQIKKDAHRDHVNLHQICYSSEVADIILAPISGFHYGPFFEKLSGSHIFRTNKSKIIVYSPDDNLHPMLPGIFPSSTRYWCDRGQAIIGHYRIATYPEFAFMISELEDKDILGSFVGTVSNHPLRGELVKLKSPDLVLRDANQNMDHWWKETMDKQIKLVSSYRETLVRSRFILCPRGVSPGSARIFEAMEAAAVPVIISNKIVLPEGPDWESFIIRVDEKNISEIPKILKQVDVNSRQMGQIARREWERYFSPETSFNSLVGWASKLMHERRKHSVALVNAEVWINSYVKIKHLKSRARYAKGRWMNRSE